MASMDLTGEVVRLRAELESVSTQRDLLLCELSNLRRELELNELKQIQDDSFNSKLDDEDSASGGGGAGGAGLVPPDGYYHHHHHHHDDSHAHHLHYLHLHHARAATSGDEPDRGYIEGNRYVAAQHRSVTGLNHSNSSCSSASTASASAAGDAGAAPLYITAPPEGFGMSAAGLTVHTSNRRGTDVSIQNTNETVLQKENVLPQKMRGKMIRGRYEMSQDLLDKQMEILERRYGGPRARRAAVVLQRAWRRRQLLRKFSAITAMAKATATAQHTIRVSVNGHQDIYSTPIPKNNGNLDKSLSLGRPMRSMSLRERHDLDNNMVNHLQSSSQHDMDAMAMAARVQQSAHQLTMLQEQRGDGDSGVCGCSVNGSVTNISMSSSHNESLHNHQHFNNSGPIYGNMLCSGGKPLSSPGSRQQVQNLRKVPPEVPKRTTSITLGQSDSPSSLRRADCCGTPPVGADARGSLSSVQSSGSDSAGSDRVHYHAAHQLQGQHQGYQNHHRTASGSGLYDSPNDRYAVWKRQNGPTPPPLATPPAPHPAYFSPDSSACCAPATHPHVHPHPHPAPQINEAVLKVSETVRKRQYRVGLNLFNKKPERGVGYLIARAFLENSPRGVARFLITRKGLSKQMIGEYLGNLQNPFNMAVLECFVNELDLSGMQVDVALRRYQAHFRLPGEAQKIERLVEAFARRYCICNADLVQRLRTNDTIFVLAFAIIMLNTDLHTPNLKPEARMSLEDFVKNLRGIDDCGDIDRDMLAGIYERVKSSEFRPGSDHVTQVLKVQATIVGKKPHLALPHRRLVCYCRLYEIPDIHKKERPGVHQREVFLFNDLLVITKIFSKKKSSVSYTFRQSFPLCGMVVNLFSVPHYPFGIRLSRRVDGRRLSTFNARNEHDRRKFAEDLRESVAEMDEMEALRIESELNRGGKTRPPSSVRNVMDNRDSGVADVELDQAVEHLQAIGSVGSTLQPPPPPSGHAPPAPSPPYNHYAPHYHHPPPTNVIKRNVLSNSLVDINDPVAIAAERLQRRGSVGSLDSGMSVSFAGGAGGGRASAPGASLCHKTVPFAHGPHALQRSPPNQSKHNHFLGGIFPVRRERKLSASGIPDNTSASRSSLGKSTEV